MHGGPKRKDPKLLRGTDPFGNECDYCCQC